MGVVDDGDALRFADDFSQALAYARA